MLSALLVAEYAPCIGGSELLINTAAAAIDAEVPGALAEAQLGKHGDPVPARAFARLETDLDLCGVEPACVLVGVVHGEAPPGSASLQRAESADERLRAVGVQDVNHQVDGPGLRVCACGSLHRVGEERCLAVAGGVGLVPADLGRDDAEDVGRLEAGLSF